LFIYFFHDFYIYYNTTLQKFTPGILQTGEVEIVAWNAIGRSLVPEGGDPLLSEC
jgi:hypothetical protein